jgi:glutathione synthase/RimK-type ligase-like ATP-grasp enzyme
VFKSVSGVRSIVTELDDGAAARLDRVVALPTQFQEHVSGVDVRVHVVGTSVFATEVRSDAIDYRYAHRTGGVVDLRAAELPPTVADRCVALAAALDLPLCGIDLRRRPDGEHVCFEANPMPAFSYYQAGTGQPIAEALVRLLTRSAAPR